MSARFPWIPAVGLAVLAFVCLEPLITDARPTPFFLELSSPPVVEAVNTAALLTVLWGIIFWRAYRDDPTPRGLWLALGMALGAAVMTFYHWRLVDTHPFCHEWQVDLYERLFRGDYEAPHQFRPLPYGFVRMVEYLAHKWLFSCLVYRWFFTYWFLWAWVRFVSLFRPMLWAYASLAVLVPLYPMSIEYYLGQLTDPLSHFLFVLALIYIVEDRVWLLAGTVALGVMAKETAILGVLAYFALQWRRFPVGWLKTFVVGAAGTLAFLAVRLPLGWKSDPGQLNGLEGLMVGTNLGIGEPIAWTPVPLWENYLHPIVFIAAFVPFIVLNWVFARWSLDLRLRWLLLVLPPLLLLSNLCFGWLYESRNYIPLLPLLCAAALPADPVATVVRILEALRRADVGGRLKGWASRSAAERRPTILPEDSRIISPDGTAPGTRSPP